MGYAHTDLLSYDDIDKDVDQIFKAFCDTTLIGFAAERVTADLADASASARHMQAYWVKVVSFRRKHLSPYDRPDFMGKAGQPKLSQAVSQVGFKRAQGFLYWFDVRADYWSSHDANQKLLDTLAPAEELETLYEKALKVQSRIHEALRSQAAGNLGSWDRSVTKLATLPPPPPESAELSKQTSGTTGSSSK